MFGFPTSSRGSPTRSAASEAPTCGLIGIRPTLMREKGWQRAFDEPIDLPGGRELVTLEDSGNYITELPKAEQVGLGVCFRMGRAETHQIHLAAVLCKAAKPIR
jgi:hypothetical protein